MAEFVGLLMIVLALGIGCWRLFKGRKLPASGLVVLVLACFIGVALVLHERVSEVSFGKLATLKAAVMQAQSDADQIAAVRQRVEAQASTIDLVAKNLRTQSVFWANSEMKMRLRIKSCTLWRKRLLILVNCQTAES